METDHGHLSNGNERGSPDAEYDDVLPLLAVGSGRYAAINVDRIQSDEMYQELYPKESREPAATLTPNGREPSSPRKEMAETLPFATCTTEQIAKEILDLKVEVSGMNRQIHRVQDEVSHQMRALTSAVQRLAMEVTQLKNQLSDIQGSLSQHIHSPNLPPVSLLPPPYRAVVATSPSLTPNSIPRLKESLC